MADVKLIVYLEDNETGNVKRYMRGETVSVFEVDDFIGTIPNDTLMGIIIITDSTVQDQQFLLEEVTQIDTNLAGDPVVTLVRRRRFFVDESLLPASAQSDWNRATADFGVVSQSGLPVVGSVTEAELMSAVVEN